MKVPVASYPYQHFILPISLILAIPAVCSECIQLCTMKKRHLLKKIQETLYIGQWCLSPLQRTSHPGTSQFSQSRSAAPPYFPESHWRSEISSLSKVILILGKSRSCRVPNLGCSGTESLGWFDVLPKISSWDMLHEQVHCRDETANHRLLIAVALLNHPNSFRGGMFKLNAKLDAYSLLYLLSHFECHGHTVHMLTQQCLPPPLTSTVKSPLFTHAHSSPLTLAARLHQCRASHSHYIKYSWTFPG